jgi:hypothetical protein
VADQKSEVRAAREGRKTWLQKRLTQLGKDESTFRQSQAFSALRGIHTEIRHYRIEFDAIRLELAEEDDAAGRIRPEDMTPEEWARKIQHDASCASLEDLEVYVAEFYQRSSLKPVAEGGVIRLVRSAS